MYFRSKYSGYCWFCQAKFKKGTWISWDAEKKKAKHQVCPERKVTKTPRRKVKFVS